MGRGWDKKHLGEIKVEWRGMLKLIVMMQVLSLVCCVALALGDVC